MSVRQSLPRRNPCFTVAAKSMIFASLWVEALRKNKEDIDLAHFSKIRDRREEYTRERAIFAGSRQAYFRWEYCDRNYHQILPIIAEKVHQEKAQQEKLKAVKARLNFEETSHHSESGTPIKRIGLKERLGPRYVRSRSGSPEPRRGRSESPKKKGPERKAVFKRLEKGVFHRLGDKGKSVSVHLDDSRRRSYYSSRRDTESCHQSSHSRATKSTSERRYNKRASSRRTEELSESEGSAGGHWKSKLKRAKSSIEDDLSQPWSAAKTERWAMQHGVTGSILHLLEMPKYGLMISLKETIDSYDDLKKAFLENYLHQKKCIKDPIEINNIRQRDGESTKEFVRMYKLDSRDVIGAPECMKISGFMHGITNPELIKRLHDKIPKSVDEIMRVITAFLRGEVAASNHERKKSFPSWKQQEANQKQNFKKGGFRNQQRNLFSILGEDNGRKVHMIIEAEIKRHTACTYVCLDGDQLQKFCMSIALADSVRKSKNN
ncbi:hypothetical protein Tco_0252608 [Tanacetum coccineum]